MLGLEEHLEGADLVITAEGRVDSSTVYEKAPAGVARLAKARGIPVIAMAGSLGPGYEQVYEHGIDAVVPILNKPMHFEDSIARTASLLRGAAERTMRLLALGQTIPEASNAGSTVGRPAGFAVGDLTPRSSATLQKRLALRLRNGPLPVLLVVGFGRDAPRQEVRVPGKVVVFVQQHRQGLDGVEHHVQ